MKKATKVLIVLCILAMAASFAACGSDDNQPVETANIPLESATEQTQNNATTAAQQNADSATEEGATSGDDHLRVAATGNDAISRAFANLGDEIALRLEHTPFYALAIMGELIDSGASTTTIDFDFRTASPQDPNVDGYVVLAFDAGAEEAMLEGEVRVMGLPIDFTALINSERIALQSRTIDRDNFYGITFDTFFEDAIQFVSLLGIDPMEILMLMGELDEVFAALDMLEYLNMDLAAQEEWAQMYADVFTGFFASIESVTERTSNNLYRTTFTFTDLQIIDLLYDLLHVFADDEFMQASFAMYETPAFDGTMPTFSEMIDEMYFALEMFETLFVGDFVITLDIDDNDRLAQIGFDYLGNVEGETIVVQATIYFGESATDTWIFHLLASDGDEFNSGVLSWSFGETSRGFENVIEGVEGTNGDSFSLASVWNPSNGRFDLSANDGNDIFGFGGTFTTTSGGFQLQLDTIDIPSVGSLAFGLSMVSGADIPSVDFINLDQWDMTLIEMVMGSIFGMLLL